MTKSELAKKSGVSISFLSDLTTGKGNPSLAVMEKLAMALDVPLSFLLESTDLDREAIEILRGRGVPTNDVPEGYERVVAILPEHRAFQVKKWAEEARNKLKSRND